MWVLEQRGGALRLFLNTSQCTVLNVYSCSGFRVVEEQKATSFCFPDHCLSLRRFFFFPFFFCGVCRAGRAWCQGAQAGSLSAGPHFLYRELTVRQAPSRPRAITQQAARRLKKVENAPTPRFPLLMTPLPLGTPYSILSCSRVGKKKTPIPSFGILPTCDLRPE